MSIKRPTLSFQKLAEAVKHLSLGNEYTGIPAQTSQHLSNVIDASPNLILISPSTPLPSVRRQKLMSDAPGFTGSGKLSII